MMRTVHYHTSMTMRDYPAMVERDTAGNYCVSFPDFPGCVAADPQSNRPLPAPAMS